jgi:hypothetical protein
LRGKVFKNANIYGTINVSELIKEVSFTWLSFSLSYIKNSNMFSLNNVIYFTIWCRTIISICPQTGWNYGYFSLKMHAIWFHLHRIQYSKFVVIASIYTNDKGSRNEKKYLFQRIG